MGVIVQDRIVRGSHFGTDLDTGRERLFIANAVLERTKQTSQPGHDIVKQKVEREDDPQRYSRRWPEKFEPVTGGQATSNLPAGMEMLPGETLNAWHARVGELVKAHTVTSTEVGATHQNGQPTTPPPGPPPSKSVPPTDMSTFDAMTVKELIAHAEAEELDIKGATKKDEIIKHIKAAYGVQ